MELEDVICDEGVAVEVLEYILHVAPSHENAVVWSWMP